MEENIYVCTHCGEIIENENDCYYVGGEPICEACAENTVICEHCGEKIWDSDDYGDENICIYTW